MRIAFDRAAITAPEVLARAGRFGSVRDVSIEEPQIGDIIRQLYEGAARPQVPTINTPLAYTGTDVTRRPDLSETES